MSPKGYTSGPDVIRPVRQAYSQYREDGQVVLLEGCSGCGAQKLDHSPIKIPNVEWHYEEGSDIPKMTRRYDFLCFKCACAMFAPSNEAELEASQKWLDEHGLTKLTLEEIRCPKIEPHKTF